MSGVGSSYVAAEFTVVETGVSENAPIILGHPFLATIKAVIYTDTVKIIFIINGKKEIFSFKNNILRTPAHPRYPYRQEYKLTVEKKRRDRRRKKNNHPRLHVEKVWMINTIQSENKNLFLSPLLPKLDDAGVPSIHCSINQ
jgi:hypothetical protein